MKRDMHAPILGCLLGTAVGDALGLPSEGMSRMRIARRWKGLRHRLVFGRGMFSDDTEHTLMYPITRRRAESARFVLARDPAPKHVFPDRRAAVRLPAAASALLKRLHEDHDPVVLRTAAGPVFCPMMPCWLLVFAALAGRGYSA